MLRLNDQPGMPWRSSCPCSAASAVSPSPCLCVLKAHRIVVPRGGNQSVHLCLRSRNAYTACHSVALSDTSQATRGFCPYITCTLQNTPSSQNQATMSLHHFVWVGSALGRAWQTLTCRALSLARHPTAQTVMRPPTCLRALKYCIKRVLGTLQVAGGLLCDPVYSACRIFARACLHVTHLAHSRRA